MSNVAVDPRLAAMATKLAGLIAALSERLGDLLDLTAGALASLIRASQLGYQDRPGALPKDYFEKLRERVRRMAVGALPRYGRWISGYYFNSAILRKVAEAKAMTTPRETHARLLEISR